MEQDIQRASIDFDHCPVDTYLLAVFASLQTQSATFVSVIDLGCGPGRLLYEYGRLHPLALLYGLELNPVFLHQAEEAFYRKGVPVYKKLTTRNRRGIHLIRGDIRNITKLFQTSSFDRVLLNPPYFQKGNGRIPPDPERAAFRHEQSATLEDFLSATAYLLKPGGCSYLIYPFQSLESLETALSGSPLKADRIQEAYSDPLNEKPTWIMMRLLHKKECQSTQQLEPILDINNYIKPCYEEETAP